MPPARTGVAVYSAEIVPALGDSHRIDVFVDEPVAAARRGEPAIHSAHDFIWRHHLEPYDLTVYQLGNSSAHDYQWPYLFRYPGLAVLHDAHLHHARAAALLRSRRANDYRAEFAANHPDVSADMAELGVAGFDSFLYYSWPMTRLVVGASRLTAVHSPLVAQTLLEDAPGAAIDTIRMAHGERISAGRARLASQRVRARHGIPEDAVLFGVFGGLTPEKRVPQVLSAFAALRPYAPDARLLLAGAPASHYDVAADVARAGIGDRVIITSYVEDDESFTEYVAACDVSVNLRWPTAREVSGPWIRALGAGRPTITTDLAHTADVPALDPRTWAVVHASGSCGSSPEPVTVSIDLVDEDHSLRLAMRRLATDPELRARIGSAAVAYWEHGHSIDGMVSDYRRVLSRAMRTPAAPGRASEARAEPAHLRADGTERVAELLAPFGLDANLWSKI